MENYDELVDSLVTTVGYRNITINNLNQRLVESREKQERQYNTIKELQKNISILHIDVQEKEQELREKERVLSDRHDIIAKQIDKIVVLRDAIHCMQGEAREKDAALGEHYDTIMKQAGKLLKLQQHIYKMKELCTHGDYEETNEWVGGCEKRVGYDDSHGQTPPGYGSTEPTRETSYTPKQSYDYRKVGL